MSRTKTSKQLERHFKGISNHWRIEILLLVRENEGITVEAIVEKLQGNFKTISEHTRRLVQSGLLNKQYHGRKVLHSLSPYGQKISEFILTFQHS